MKIEKTKGVQKYEFLQDGVVTKILEERKLRQNLCIMWKAVNFSDQWVFYPSVSILSILRAYYDNFTMTIFPRIFVF